MEEQTLWITLISSALNSEVLDILRRRHTDNSTYKSRAPLQYGHLGMKMQRKFSPNSLKTNSTYYVDVRVSKMESPTGDELTMIPVSSLFLSLTAERKDSAQQSEWNPSNAHCHTRLVRKLGICRYQSHQIHSNIQMG